MIYKVIRHSARDIEAKSGYDMDVVLETDSAEKAEEYISNQTDKSGFIYYTIQEEEE